MDVRINFVLALVLGLIWAGLTAVEPEAALDPSDEATVELVKLEDEFAAHPENRELARRISETYLTLEQPGLAIGALRSADPVLLEDPLLMHRLAEAYEQSGRVRDALATADLAAARCARSLGTVDSSAVTPVPRYACTERNFLALEVHRTALAHMVRWRLEEPSRDPRVRLAYELAERRVSIAWSDSH